MAITDIFPCTSNYPGHALLNHHTSMRSDPIHADSQAPDLKILPSHMHTLGWYMMYSMYAGNTSPSKTKKMTLITRIITKGES